jgi:hypothetical protein
MTTLTCGVLGGFSAIRISHGNPLLVLVYGVLCVNSFLVYISVFQLAYQITERSEELRRIQGISLSRLRSPVDRKYCEKFLRSVPPMAMSVGGFYRIERESVPIFVDFVVGQIVSLLIIK